MKAHPAEIISKIAEQSGTGSRKAQEKIITEHLDVPEFVKVVEYANDPFRNFYVATVPGLSDVAAKAKQRSTMARKGVVDMFDDDDDSKTTVLPWKEQFRTMFELLDNLSSRKLAPNSGEARNAILDWAKHCGSGAIECFKKIINKDLRCNVGTTTFNKIKPNWIREFKIQLAKPFDEKKLSFPCYVEPKFDGERCLAFLAFDGTDGGVTFFSRNGIQFQNYGCFTSELLRLFKGHGQVIVDCEVIHKQGFQAGQKVPVNYDPTFTGDNLQLIVFDWVPQDAFDAGKHDLTQEKRTAELSKIFRGLVYGDPQVANNKIVMVDTKLARSIEEAYDIYDHWVGKGLEGVIMKQPDGLYEFKRTDSWLKWKPTQTADLKVVGIELGDSKKKWAGKCGSIVVERTAKDGSVVKVNVASGLLEHDHENIQEIGNQIIWKSPTGELIDIKGKIVEVAYDCETDDGSLRFPRIKRREATFIRTDK